MTRPRFAYEDPAELARGARMIRVALERRRQRLAAEEAARLPGPWPVMPGVPAAGHLSGGGFWHPGSPEGCPKCPAKEAK